MKGSSQTTAQKPFPHPSTHSSAANFGSDQDAISIFVSVKDIYSAHIEDLTELKKELYKTDVVDQQQKSKLRITIESILIDLNEEIFTISEELAKSFTYERSKNILQKARECDHRKAVLLKKIEKNIDNNPAIKLIRRNVRIASQTPPSKDNAFSNRSRAGNNMMNLGRGTDLKGHFYNESPSNFKGTGKISQKSSARKQGGEIFQTQKYADRSNLDSAKHHKIKSNSFSMKKEKSPVPLRRKEVGNASFAGHESAGKHGSQKKLNNSSVSKHEDSFRSKSKQKKNPKKLDQFERFLACKKGNKENKAPVFSQPLEDKFINQSSHSTAGQNDAFDAFAQEFTYMKQKMLNMQTRMSENEERSKYLQDEVEKLKTENVKLASDMKIIRGEHSEMLHSLYSLEKKNTHLQHENQVLKRLLAGEREMKGQESNMPKQYIEKPDYSMQDSTNKHPPSPMSSNMQKNRSFSYLRESKESTQPNFLGTGQPDRIQQLMGESHRMEEQQQTSEYKSRFVNFQPQQQQQNQPREYSQEGQQMGTKFGSASKWQGNFGIGHSQDHFRNPLSSNEKPIYTQPLRHNLRQSSSFTRPMIQEQTPVSPSQALLQNDTPANLRTDSSKPRAFLLNKRDTPTSASFLQHNINNEGQLSDWVLERMSKKS